MDEIIEQEKITVPSWVQIALWGIKSRKQMVWSCLAMGIIGLVLLAYYYWNYKQGLPHKFYVPVFFIFFNVIYVLAIRWMDRKGDWNDLSYQPSAQQTIAGFAFMLFVAILLHWIFKG